MMTGWELIVLVAGYLVACALAYLCHEGAHYIVHARFAQSVRIGINRYQPYVAATYGEGSLRWGARLGSVMPTLLFTPLVIVGIYWYTTRYPIPDLSPTVWTMVVVPLLILVFPTAGDRDGFLNPPN